MPPPCGAQLLAVRAIARTVKTMCMETRTTVNACQAVLHDRGWSCGDMAFYDGHAVVLQVFAHQAEQRIAAQAPTQGEAWLAAAEQARTIGSV